MARVSVSDSTLVVQIDGLDRVSSGKSRMEFPLANVTGVQRISDHGRTAPWKGVTSPGPIPKFATAGVFARDGHRTFWNVHDPDSAIVIDLTGALYARLMLDVADPAETVSHVAAALRARRQGLAGPRQPEGAGDHEKSSVTLTHA
jgi:hypothetical protein